MAPSEAQNRYSEEETHRPLVSVVMAEYNTNLAHLRTAIESVLRQRFTDFEFILIDDGGSHDVQAIADSFSDPRMRVIENSGNIGFVRSLNRGILEARAPLIARMDTDDIYDYGHLDALVKAMSEHPEYSAISTRAWEYAPDIAPLVIGQPGEVSKTALLRGHSLIHPGSMFRRDAWAEVGGYPAHFRRAEDFAFWCELLLAGKRLRVIDIVTFSYRVSISDYSKRRIRHRGGEVRARLHYNRLLGSGSLGYLRILRSIVGGILPGPLVRRLRHFELRRKKGRA